MIRFLLAMIMWPFALCPAQSRLPAGVPEVLQGRWRAVMDSPGGDLPFIFHIDAGAGGTMGGYIANGPEKAEFSGVAIRGDSLILEFSHYDSSLRFRIAENGDSLAGCWERRGLAVLGVYALKGMAARFSARAGTSGGDAPRDISGSWNVQFRDARSVTPATAIFGQEGGVVNGTFLAPTGDYRFLEGTYEDGILRLSCFDGTHAYLFEAAAGPGGKLHGDYYSSATYHAEWTAERGTADLPDAYSMTEAADREGSFTFAFPDLEGNIVSDSDERFQGKALIVNVYGSWCPNCNDEAPFLVELYQKYNRDGLEIVGLANEYSDDFDKNATMVRRFAKRHGIPWLQLIVGRADKSKTAEALKSLTGIAAYPTTIFIDRTGVIRKVHSGFAGPATGKYHEELKRQFIEIIEAML